MNNQVDAQKVIDELLDQLKQANLQIAILRVMVADANSTSLQNPQQVMVAECDDR